MTAVWRYPSKWSRQKRKTPAKQVCRREVKQKNMWLKNNFERLDPFESDENWQEESSTEQRNKLISSCFCENIF